MIIRDIEFDRGVVDVEDDGEFIKVTNVQDLDPLLKDLALRKQEQNEGGFSKDRTMRYIGSIPASAIAINPELGKNAEAALDFLNNEGSQFRVNKVNTGRSGKVIIK